MPATAGRVRMPANNRVHSSAALQTHGIWQSAIGYDPYAPDQKQSASDAGALAGAGAAAEQNAYDSFQGLLALARLTGSNADEARGSCKRCGRVGHLTFQCRNFLTVKEEAVAAAAALVERDGTLRKDKSKDGAEISSSEEESSDDESELSDSEADPEIEKAIAAKFGKDFLLGTHKKRQKKQRNELPKRERSGRSSSKKRKSKTMSSSDLRSIDSDSDTHEKRRRKRATKERRKSKKRSSDGSDDDSPNERRSKRAKLDHYKEKSETDRKRRPKRHGTGDSETLRKKRRNGHLNGKSSKSRKYTDIESDVSSDVEKRRRNHSRKKRDRAQHRGASTDRSE